MKKKIRLAALAVVLTLLAVWIYQGNVTLERTDYTIASDRLPSGFDGFRIVQISDLHNTRFGTENKELLEMIREAEPDMIAITGDLVDSRRTDMDAAMEFVSAAVELAPCYYVTGNHEMRMPEEFALLEARLLAAGVGVLRGEIAVLEREGSQIAVAGIDDPRGITEEKEEEASVIAQALAPLETELFTLLLTHWPAGFSQYCSYGADAVLAGHNHGGQFRLPWLGGLYAEGELFPEYDSGVFQQGQTQMVVSRGLGNSLFPFRINNNPQIIVITLAKSEGAAG